jgi:hypothetical protein
MSEAGLENQQIINECTLDRWWVMPFVLLLIFSLPSIAVVANEMRQHDMHTNKHQKNHQVSGDQRQRVVFPAKTYDETLASMREHLRAVNSVIRFMAESQFDKAADAVEKGLGIGHQHGIDGLQSGHAYMPPQMRQYGQAMHMKARDLVVHLRDTEVTGDISRALNALNGVTQQCVACHDSFRLIRGD